MHYKEKKKYKAALIQTSTDDLLEKIKLHSL